MPKSPRGTNSSGANGKWLTSITQIEPNRVLLRGYPVDELMGRVGFGEAIHVLLTGELPSPSIGLLVEAMLVSFIDHGATPPSTLSARNAASTGASLRGCVAAGILGFGRHHGGDTLACRARLDEGLALMRDGQPAHEAARAIVARMIAADDIPPPGFGHRYHTKDPRAARLLQMAHELEVDGVYTQLLRAIEHLLGSHPDLEGRSLPINVDGAIAAICGDVGFPPEVADALLLISRVPGLAAHALEEQRREPPMRPINPTAHSYDGPAERQLPARRK
jgi:citrate synthase